MKHDLRTLESLDHLVVQDLFLTETAAFADVILPASAFPEKDGTFTNTNRQVQIGRKALPLPGDARQDLWIIQEIARRLDLDWNYTGPDEVFAEMAQCMPSFDGPGLPCLYCQCAATPSSATSCISEVRICTSTRWFCGPITPVWIDR